MNDPRAGIPLFLKALAEKAEAKGYLLDGVQVTVTPPHPKCALWMIAPRVGIAGKVISTQWNPPPGFDLELWPEMLADGLCQGIDRLLAPPESERPVLQ